jgi:pilus assembly protein FimV
MSAAAWLFIIPLACLAGWVHGIGLGEVSEQSAFGTSLRVVVPVLAGAGEELAGECVKLMSARQGDDGIPEVRNARTALERTASGARIVVMSPRPVTDPVLRLTLQVGCDSAVRREYLLLLDPLPIDVPVVAQDSSAQRAAAATLVAETTRTTAGDGAAAGAAGATAAVPAPRAAARRRATTTAGAPGAGAPARGKTAPKSRTATVKAAPKAATAPAARPRLTVSTEIPVVEAAAPGKGATGTAPAGTTAAAASRVASPQESSSAALDAEAAALQQRVAELTGMVDRMQREMRATEALQAAQNARIAAENAAKATPAATVGRWWDDNWPLLLGVVVLAALIAAVLSYRRRRTTAASGQWRLETTSQGRAPLRRRMAPPAPTGADALSKSVAASSPGPQVTTLPSTSTTVHVSELSHVTEEAGVYLAFNRPDRAIEVLREHIRATPQSLPAAWLMLLDLYHAQGNESEFGALAEKFHAQFNAQTPTWDAYRPLAQSDRGLEAFPHLVRQLGAVWGKPACRGILDDLLHENRDGRRTGFSITACEDIIFLRQLADTLSGDSRAVRPVPLPPAARTPAPSAAALAGVARRPPTLDLELALDEDMLDAGKSSSTVASTAQSAKEPPPRG